MTTTSPGKAAEFAVCIHGNDDDVDLIVGKIYRVMKPKRNDKNADIRVVDESGEDYLYPRAWFVRVALPLKARKVLAASNEV